MEQELLDRLDAVAARMSEAFSAYAPEALEALVTALQVVAVKTLVAGGALVILCPLVAYAALRVILRFENDEASEGAALASLCVILVAIFSFIAGLVYLFDTQAWLAVIDPRARIAYDAWQALGGGK